VTFDGERVVVAQALVWPHPDRPTPSVGATAKS
jgi:hypothetical protein